MKKIIALAVFVLMISSVAMAQQTSVIVKNEKSTYVADGTEKCTFTFELAASDEVFNDIKAHADLMADKYTCTFTKNKNGNYKVVMKIKIGEGLHVVQRCVATLGLNEFVLADDVAKKYNIHQLGQVLTAPQEK